MWEMWQRRFGWRTDIRPKVATTPFGFKAHIQLQDRGMQRVLWLTGRWEPFITEYFRSTLAPGDTFVDVGANIGYYSLLASRIVGPSGRVYSIEASPTILALLRRNIALNHANNVEVIHALVSDHDGDQEFWLASEQHYGQSTSVPSRASEERMRSEGRIRCGALTSIVPADQLLNARLIKIDAEGAERAIMEPLVKHLPEFSNRTVWEVELTPEYCPGGHADVTWIFDCFCRNGYVAFAMRNDYSPKTYLSRPKSVEMKRITAAPAYQADVLFLRE
jgi:FkbM family methyltransferase